MSTGASLIVKGREWTAKNGGARIYGDFLRACTAMATTKKRQRRFSGSGQRFIGSGERLFWTNTERSLRRQDMTGTTCTSSSYALRIGGLSLSPNRSCFRLEPLNSRKHALRFQ